MIQRISSDTRRRFPYKMVTHELARVESEGLLQNRCICIVPRVGCCFIGEASIPLPQPGGPVKKIISSPDRLTLTLL
jgi:hypothetical protein